jgi:hypothetical protein
MSRVCGLEFKRKHKDDHANRLRTSHRTTSPAELRHFRLQKLSICSHQQPEIMQYPSTKDHTHDERIHRSVLLPSLRRIGLLGYPTQVLEFQFKTPPHNDARVDLIFVCLIPLLNKLIVPSLQYKRAPLNINRVQPGSAYSRSVEPLCIVSTISSNSWSRSPDTNHPTNKPPSPTLLARSLKLNASQPSHSNRPPFPVQQHYPIHIYQLASTDRPGVYHINGSKTNEYDRQTKHIIS